MGNKEFYSFAKAYDIAFNGRDYSDEANFVEWCFNKHAREDVRTSDKLSFLELGCGPGYHALEFAKNGWDTYALDLSEDMIEYAKKKAKEQKQNVEFVHDNMIEYRLEKPVHLTGIFTESITHILTNDQFITHLRTVSKNLVSGGIYLIETAHPRFFFPDDEPNIWTSKHGNTEVKVLFGTPEDNYDSFTQQWNVTTRMEVRENGALTDVVETKSKHRWYLAQEIISLVQLSGAFDAYWFYGNMEIPPNPLDDSEESDSMIIVLRAK